MDGSVWIVIVNYRTADLAVECLHSIAGQIAELPEPHTVVVDNASGDGSVEKLIEVIDRQGWHGWASVIPLDRNGGFAFGNNVGIGEALRSACHVDYVMLLNPDTIVHGGRFACLLILWTHINVSVLLGTVSKTQKGKLSVRHDLSSAGCAIHQEQV